MSFVRNVSAIATEPLVLCNQEGGADVTRSGAETRGSGTENRGQHMVQILHMIGAYFRKTRRTFLGCQWLLCKLAVPEWPSNDRWPRSSSTLCRALT